MFLPARWQSPIRGKMSVKTAAKRQELLKK